MKASLQAEGDVDAFCDVLRIMGRTPLLIDLNFSDKRMETAGATWRPPAWRVAGSSHGFEA